MPKKYEDEIREILKGMDEDAPRTGTRGWGSGGRVEGGRGHAQRPQRPQMPSLQLGNLLRDPQKLMGGALILMLFAWVMQGFGFGGPVVAWAGYVSLASLVLFIVALIAMVRNRGAFGGPGAPREQRWRGQVIYLPNRQPFWTRWWHSIQRTFQRSGRGRSSGTGRRGSDSIRW